MNPYIHEGITSHSHIYVRLVDISATQALATWRWPWTCGSSRAQITNLRYKVVIPSALGGGETFFPIRAIILGPDLDARRPSSPKRLADRMRQVQGLLDVEPYVSLNSPELQVKIDRQRASRPRGAGGRHRGRGAADDRGRGPDLHLQGRRRAVRRDHAAPARAAEGPRPAVPAHDPVLQGGPGAARQRGHHRARPRARAHRALQPAVPGDGEREQRARLPARRRGARGAARP